MYSDVLFGILTGERLPSGEKKDVEEVTISEVGSGLERVIIRNRESIEIIEEAIAGSVKQPGMVDMAEPQYRISLGEETYFLWFTRLDGTMGTVMNAKDTHTVYTLSEDSTAQIKKLLLPFSVNIKVIMQQTGQIVQ